MIFDPPLITGRLIKRYKRFLADVCLDSGEELTVHCPNPGRMTTCSTPGWPVAISTSSNPKRKLKHTLEMIHDGQQWIGVNPSRANALVKEALDQKRFPQWKGYSQICQEVAYGTDSRLDFLLQAPDLPDLYLEVKYATLKHDGHIKFPDAPSKRGQKHLKTLMDVVAAGHQAVLLFVVARGDGQALRPAEHIDPDYTALFAESEAKAVKIEACRWDFNPEGASISEKLEVI